MKKLSVLLLVCFSISLHAQQSNYPVNDSSETTKLSEIIVKGYEQNRKLLEVPAAINYIGKVQLDRFNNTNVLPALNSTPGVRMEERSPGSYRLNIRGSSLRSPFGVRNVKIYYDGIPYTDPGGNTYFNQLGFYNFQSIEVIKGPGSSLYGAGTGGVLLIKTNPSAWQPGISLDYLAGSYNLQNANLNIRIGNNDYQNSINYQHESGDGYRQHTNLRRDIFSWDAIIKSNERSELTGHFFYGDLFYETPGALTKAEYDKDPELPRPGAIQTKAAVFQQTFLAGINYKQKFSQAWSNSIAVYGASTQLNNPTTRNYGRASQPHAGGRTIFGLKKQLGGTLLAWQTGGEVQQGFTTTRTYSNLNGNPDTLQTDDEINNRQWFLFTQLSLDLPDDWVVTSGLSLNRNFVRFTRLSTSPTEVLKRTYKNELAPRFAILKKLTGTISAYATVARGFSPPTTAELLPSTGVISTGLEAEHGINYEIGSRGSILQNRFYYDINVFFFQLKNTIVQRKDGGGADYFINAGSTRQNGIETYLSYQLAGSKTSFIRHAQLWLSHTWHHFRYKDFKQVTNDYSGNKLPSIAPQVLAAGVDMTSKPGLHLHITYYFSDPVPLDDLNTVYANSFNLLGGRLGFKSLSSKKWQVEIFCGIDNALDEKYSLGNDINAFGGRFFNAAPRRNYYTGISLHISGKNKQ